MKKNTSFDVGGGGGQIQKMYKYIFFMTPSLTYTYSEFPQIFMSAESLDIPHVVAGILRGCGQVCTLVWFRAKIAEEWSAINKVSGNIGIMCSSSASVNNEISSAMFHQSSPSLLNIAVGATISPNITRP